MKACILSTLLALSFSYTSFATDLDGMPEVAAPAGEIISTNPLRNFACDKLKQAWKDQYKNNLEYKRKIDNKEEQVNFQTENEMNEKLHKIKNNLMSTGCVQSTDGLKKEVEDEMNIKDQDKGK